MPQQFEFPGKRTPPQLRFSPRMLLAVIGVLAALWVLSGTYTVGPDERAVILRFGKFHREVGPGLHYHLPAPVEMRLVRSVTQIYRLEVGFRTVDPGPPARYRNVPKESLMLTGDENIISVEMVVQFRVRPEAVRDAVFNVRGLGAFEKRGGGLVHAASEAALRQVIGSHSIEMALTEGKLIIQTEIAAKLQEIFDRYVCGLAVVAVQLQSVNAPAHVDAAFKDVASAKEDRERLVNEAHGYQNDVIPKARGEAEKVLKGAEAYSIERVRGAQGDADRFRLVYAEYAHAPKVTETRLYIEAMERILPRMRLYIIESDQGGGLLNILNLDRKDGER